MKKSIILFFILGVICFFVWHEKENIRDINIIGLSPIVNVKLNNGEIFKIKLYPEEAPNTVSNFIELVQAGYYDGLPFTVRMPHYLLLTGDVIGDGTGYAGYFIKSECKGNDFPNDLDLKAGIVCMARSTGYNTESTQFFILLDDNQMQKGKYTAFGSIIEGLDSLDALSTQEGISSTGIQEMTVETFGEVYEVAEVIRPTY